MRRIDREITDINEIEKIIAQSYACRIGLVDKDMPYVVALNFGYVKGSPAKLYFHCGVEGKKLDLIARNNNACFQFDINPEIIVGEKACGFSMKYQSVIGFGKIRRVESEQEKIEALNAIMKQYTGKAEYEYNPKILQVTVALRLDIDSISGKQKT